MCVHDQCPVSRIRRGCDTCEEKASPVRPSFFTSPSMGVAVTYLLKFFRIHIPDQIKLQEFIDLTNTAESVEAEKDEEESVEAERDEEVDIMKAKRARQGAVHNLGELVRKARKDVREADDKVKVVDREVEILKKRLAQSKLGKKLAQAVEKREDVHASFLKLHTVAGEAKNRLEGFVDPNRKRKVELSPWVD